MSFIEAAASTFVGFCVSWALTFFVLPIWGFEPTAHDAAGITAVYTIASFLRSWAVRAAFRRIWK